MEYHQIFKYVYSRVYGNTIIEESEAIKSNPRQKH